MTGKIEEAGETAVAANAMGGSSSASGPIQMFDPLLGAGKKKLKRFSQMFKRKEIDRGSK